MATLLSEKPNNPVTREELMRRDFKCAQKAMDKNQLSFTVIEQDNTAPETICEWIKLNIKTCPADKLYDALQRAIAMRESEVMKKNAD